MILPSTIEEIKKIDPNPQKLVYKNKLVDRILFGNEVDEWGNNKCGDCGCYKGSLHYIGCDIERCPICGRQLISCEHIFDYA